MALKFGSVKITEVEHHTFALSTKNSSLDSKCNQIIEEKSLLRLIDLTKHSTDIVSARILHEKTNETFNMTVNLYLIFQNYLCRNNVGNFYKC